MPWSSSSASPSPVTRCTRSRRPGRCFHALEPCPSMSTPTPKRFDGSALYRSAGTRRCRLVSAGPVQFTSYDIPYATTSRPPAAPGSSSQPCTHRPCAAASNSVRPCSPRPCGPPWPRHLVTRPRFCVASCRCWCLGSGRVRAPSDFVLGGVAGFPAYLFPSLSESLPTRVRRPGTVFLTAFLPLCGLSVLVTAIQRVDLTSSRARNDNTVGQSPPALRFWTFARDWSGACDSRDVHSTATGVP